MLSKMYYVNTLNMIHFQVAGRGLHVFFHLYMLNNSNLGLVGAVGGPLNHQEAKHLVSSGPKLPTIRDPVSGVHSFGKKFQVTALSMLLFKSAYQCSFVEDSRVL